MEKFCVQDSESSFYDQLSSSSSGSYCSLLPSKMGSHEYAMMRRRFSSPSLPLLRDPFAYEEILRRRELVKLAACVFLPVTAFLEFTARIACRDLCHILVSRSSLWLG